MLKLIEKNPLAADLHVRARFGGHYARSGPDIIICGLMKNDHIRTTT